MIKDITHWKVNDELMASGTREKYWVICPNTRENYLFKLPKENTGEIWAEKIAAEIGKSIGLNMMTVEIAIYNNQTGLLLRNFSSKTNEFFDGGDLIKRNIIDFQINDLTDYTLDNVMNAIAPFRLEQGILSTLVFDALIANQDRHCENWGIIFESSDDIKMSPIFDNGASLGYSNSVDQIDKMLRDSRMFEAFTNRSKSIIGLPEKKRPKLREFLLELKKNYPEFIKSELKRIERLNPVAVENILETIPETVMSNTYKKWVFRLLFYRKTWIFDLLKES
ncbi:HipA domain-containing protein [Exiguobacterium sp. KRL4]|uniref:HipA domain-containing protein n=1 Tax=Exiguobacterium sp. KRL4 TaxID=1914536 RepID=UPI0009F63DD3|nr:HipA domain-containing protein [Exiguobacterium sp. KRL4]